MFFGYETLQRELAVQNADMQRELAGIKLSKQKTLRLDIDDSIEAIRVNPAQDTIGTYAVDVSFNLKNISEKSIRVPFHVLEIFVGRISIGFENEHLIKVVNEPGFDVSSVDGGELVKCKLLHREITKIDEEIDIPEFPGITESEVTTTDGWGVGVADSGEMLGGGVRSLISAMPTDYVAYRVGVFYETEDGETDEWHFSDFVTFIELTNEHITKPSSGRSR